MINHNQLRALAHAILVEDLENHGNVLSSSHAAALLELVDSFTSYCTGAQGGRRAFALPTGMGKTSAVTAFLTALHRLGYTVPVAVAASRVEALCRLKQDLLAHGLPDALVGLKHADPNASEASTGDESRQFQLVTHARVRGGRDFDLFGHHEGAQRPLCIYDETLMRADTFAFAETDMRRAMALLKIELERQTDPLTTSLVAYLEVASTTIAAALAELRGGGDEARNGRAVDLPPLDEALVSTYCDAVRRAAGGLGPWAQQLVSLLSVSQEALQVLTAEQGGGIVAVREAVPSALRNVVILDASTPIRELVKLDPTIISEQGIPPNDLKSYEAVQVHQLVASGGRGSVEATFRANSREASAVSREVIDIVRDNQSNARAFLIFSFLPRRGQVDVLGELKKDLTRAGFDLAQRTADDLPRFEFLTWGNQEGLNGYEHCDVVIMAGVLHRGHLDIAAAVKGQVGHLGEPTPSARLRQVIESEVAHVVYQGASRGSCRRIHHGKAVPMKLYLIHRNAALKTILDRVMPGAVWHYPEPRHLKKALAEGRAAQLFGQLLAYLRGLPEGVADKVSTQSVKKALSVPKGSADAKAWTRCLDLLDIETHGWALDAKSLMRVTYGFDDHVPLPKTGQ